MKPDITSRADIEKFIGSFYEHVKQDKTIGFIFTDVADMNWEKHIPLIVDFWETILLDNPVYKKNAMEVHYDLNKKTPLQKEHLKAGYSYLITLWIICLKEKLQSWQKQGQNLLPVLCYLK